MSDTHAPPFEDRPPDSDRVTPHDELHLVTYLRMPDAKAGGTDWREVVRTVFGLDPDHSDRARQIYGLTWRALDDREGLSGFTLQTQGRTKGSEHRHLLSELLMRFPPLPRERKSAGPYPELGSPSIVGRVPDHVTLAVEIWDTPAIRCKPCGQILASSSTACRPMLLESCCFFVHQFTGDSLTTDPVGQRKSGLPPTGSSTLI